MSETVEGKKNVNRNYENDFRSMRSEKKKTEKLCRKVLYTLEIIQKKN